MNHALSTSNHRRRPPAFTLLEILAAITIIGITAAIVLVRFSDNSDNAKANACYVNKGNIEVQAQLWYRNKGTWPLANLSDIGADTDYLPDGLPPCPVDGTSYTFDANSQQVTGHVH